MNTQHSHLQVGTKEPARGMMYLDEASNCWWLLCGLLTCGLGEYTVQAVAGETGDIHLTTELSMLMSYLADIGGGDTTCDVGGGANVQHPMFW